MKINDVICVAGRSGYYFDDQRAVKQGCASDGFVYVGEPITEGFTSIRQVGEAISVLLILEDGQVAWGDCAAVQYSGAGGRDPLFLAEDFIPLIQQHVAPALIGKEADLFKTMAEMVDQMRVSGRPLHTAIRYGVTQALLDAVAKSHRKLMCEIVAEEYGTSLAKSEIPIMTQSGEDRYRNVDKMIVKGASVLPHALINNMEKKLGKDGAILKEYVGWLRERILALRSDDRYHPSLHIDVYGTLGQAFGNDNYSAIVSYITQLADIAAPFKLSIEGPVDVEDREKQMIALREIRKLLDAQGTPAEIVADEWCNTLDDIRYFADNKAGHMIHIKTPDLGGINNIIEAVLYCKEKGIRAYLGGTCNETDRSTEVCVHLAMATGPDQTVAKPGMGVDEGFSTTYNEMQRILALTGSR